ncbi:hypothetical protein O181_004127 [Austropuccinia psidii MF-1]|uniref:Uncharacterized protein n=1 Tax=Austropuccinia psidii MF-1 TaxID=1389203 RepID=A0A9Q3GFH4_9BASI|nr:hypothetical protein [Austropuccinia psidii MF-1]
MAIFHWENGPFNFQIQLPSLFNSSTILQPFKPPIAPTAWQLGPFWPKSNEAKRGQGGSPSAPKPHVVTPEPQPFDQYFKKATHSHIMQDSTHGLWQPPEVTNSGLAWVPLKSRELLSLSYGPHTAGTRNGQYYYDAN